ncbi:hypothetical protein AVEN_149711-1 [Araneus ventricosus]|uniref:Uncharacterized protein n=1 Tax=Araneus ventricosus TaxID=182803 RepID=A0A4Y2V4X3_ARAVE|nr:hypothetical protein AVEN_149711-1 [Araneus ventricosus]
MSTKSQLSPTTSCNGESRHWQSNPFPTSKKGNFPLEIIINDFSRDSNQNPDPESSWTRVGFPTGVQRVFKPSVSRAIKSMSLCPEENQVNRGSRTRSLIWKAQACKEYDQVPFCSAVHILGRSPTIIREESKLQ